MDTVTNVGVLQPFIFFSLKSLTWLFLFSVFLNFKVNPGSDNQEMGKGFCNRIQLYQRRTAVESDIEKRAADCPAEPWRAGDWRFQGV